MEINLQQMYPCRYINIIKEDALNFTENILIHQVNCKGVMGSGIALQIKKKWNKVYEEYVIKCNQYSKAYSFKNLGEYQFVKIGDSKFICNMFTQDNFGVGKHTRYDHLTIALSNIFQEASRNGFSIAMPYEISCGLAGGNWLLVYPLIVMLAEELEIDVILYKKY